MRKIFFLFLIFVLLVACAQEEVKEVVETQPAEVEETFVQPEPTPVVPTEVKEEIKEVNETVEETEVIETKTENGTVSEVKSIDQIINVDSTTFEPRSLTVKVGTKVTWEITDSRKHRFYTRDRKTFDSGNLAEGGSFSYTFEKSGTFQYLDVSCTGCGWYEVIVE